MTESTAIPPPLRRGFTLTELLVVLLVIAVLAAIITVGISGVVGGTEGKSTRVRLEAMTTLLANYERNNAGSVGAGVDSAANRLPNSLSPVTPISAPPAPTDLGARGEDDHKEPSDTGFDPDNQFARTRLVLKRLLRVPVNRAVVDDLPTEARGFYAGDDDPAKQVPVVVDGFQNVILHVPPAGLRGTSRDEPDKNNGGVYFAAFDAFDTAFDDGEDPRLVARDGRDFFASAGPDGDFRTGDDNLYSTDVLAVYGPNASDPDKRGQPILTP